MAATAANGVSTPSGLIARTPPLPVAKRVPSFAMTNLETDEESTYQIMGADESDLNQGTISVSAPLSRALIGKSTGDEVEVRLPGGTRRYEIASIEFR